MSSLIASKIASVQRKHALVALGTGLAMVVAAGLTILAVTMIVDWWFELSWASRAASLAINLSAMVFLAVRFIVLPIVFGPDAEQVGLWVEEKEPIFQSRLITSIQLTRENALPAGASRAMLAAVVNQTEAIAGQLDFGRVISTDRMLRMISLAVLVVLLGLIGLAGGGTDASDLLKRALLVPGVPVPRKTHVLIDAAEEIVVARGDEVVISARARGVVPDSGRIVIRYESGKEQEVDILPADPEQDPALFSRILPNVQESFSYTVHLYDGRSAEHRVRTELRPAVAQVELHQIYPAYTGLGRVKRSTGDLSLLEGSRLAIRVKANKPLAPTPGQDPARPHNAIHLAGSDVRFPLQVDPADPTQLIAMDGARPHIPLPTMPQPTTGFSVHLVDEHGLSSRDPAVYRIDLLPDRPPTVRILAPTRKEELATARASLVIGFDAADDFALGAARIRYVLRAPEERAAEGEGLRAEYFDRPDFTGNRVVSLVPEINFPPSENRPHEGIPPHRFSARWTGVVVPPETGLYTFIAEADDNIRVSVDGRVLIDEMDSSAWNKVLRGGPIPLEAGQPYDLRIDFHQGPSLWYARLRWKLANNPEHIIPRSALYPSRQQFERSRRQDQPPIHLNLGGTPRSIRGHYTWDLSQLPARPPVGTIIEWWVEVEDTNDVSGPGLAASERYLTRIVSEEEKRAELMLRLGETWNPIDALADDQRRLNENLGQRLQEQAKP